MKFFYTFASDVKNTDYNLCTSIDYDKSIHVTEFLDRTNSITEIQVYYHYSPILKLHDKFPSSCYIFALDNTGIRYYINEEISRAKWNRLGSILQLEEFYTKMDSYKLLYFSNGQQERCLYETIYKRRYKSASI